jgi:regulator of sirC expression with transglutaminase-like and TPR domain
MRHADYDREAVIEWMIRHQLSRRNQTPEQISYYRGKLYAQMKKAEGGRMDRSFGVDKMSTPKTADVIAQEYNKAQERI